MTNEELLEKIELLVGITQGLNDRIKDIETTFMDFSKAMRSALESQMTLNRHIGEEITELKKK
jgi:hypothetical protein